MQRNSYFIAIALFGMINGIPFVNPAYIIAFAYSAKIMAVPFFGSVSLIAFFSSLLVSTATIIVGGIPAALYERYVGAKEDSTVASLWIWLAGTALLTLPAMGNFISVGL
jgi:hypothetical protein